MHYRLNVSFDAGATWAYTGSSAEGGIPVADGLSLQDGVSFGGVNAILGNITAIAADPTGAHVYVTYGMEDASGADRIYLAEFHPDATGNLVERGNPVALSVAGQRSALPSVAVTANGSIAVQYDTFTDADGQFHVHLATSTDQGLTFTDQDLNDFTAAGIPFPFSRNRLLGDYQGLIAVGNTVFGTFAARGNVQIPGQGIDTTDKIDPFFYSVTLPGGHLNLLPAATSYTAGTASGADASISTSGAPRFFGAAMPDRFGAEFTVLSEVPAAAPAFAFPLSGQAMTPLPTATTPNGRAAPALAPQPIDEFFAAMVREDGNWAFSSAKQHTQDGTEDLWGCVLSQDQWC
jgi:hypothetical protein